MHGCQGSADTFGRMAAEPVGSLLDAAASSPDEAPVPGEGAVPGAVADALGLLPAGAEETPPDVHADRPPTTVSEIRAASAAREADMGSILPHRVTGRRPVTQRPGRTERVPSSGDTAGWPPPLVAGQAPKPHRNPHRRGSPALDRW